MDYLVVKNWTEFQHYRDRLPPWIKLHRALLTDYAFCHLPDETKGHLMMLWLLASQMDGRIPNDAKWIGQRIGATRPLQLQALIDGGWLIHERRASNALADCKQDAIAETETYKATEAETQKPGGRATDLPEWVPKPVWQDFVAYRKQQKGWSGRAEVLLLQTLEKLRATGQDPIAVIEQSIANGWKGLFPIRGLRESTSDRRTANLNAIGKSNGRIIPGTAERVDRTPVHALAFDVRQQGTDDVRGGGPGGPDRDVG